MLHCDPPDHTRLRRLVQKPFAARRAALRPRAEEIAAGLLDELAARDGDVIDLLDRYARPLPIAVICELLGVPVADRQWIRDTVYAYDEPTEHERVERELAAYFTEQLAAKRAEPGDDLVSALVLARDDAGGAGDTLTGGVNIPAGEWVFPVISSADRDPAQFPGADRLDFSRDASGHVAFGHGVHHCLGAPLARMEAEVALGALLARFPGLSPAIPPQELRWRPVRLAQ
jgi:cytochrome P450